MTDPTAELPMVIDSTMLTTFRACKQKFYTEFVLGRRPARTSIHLHAGGAIASGIEEVRRQVYNNKLPLNEALKKAYVVFSDYWGDFEAPSDSYKTRFNCFRAVTGYFDMWPPATDHVRPMNFGRGGTFEFSFALPTKVMHPSGQPFIFGGRVDMLGEWLGKPVIVDEKTMKSMSSSFAHQWSMRGQFIGYCYALKQLGLKVDTALVRGLALLKTELKYIEAPQPYSDFLIARWEKELTTTLQEIRHCWDTEDWPLNFGDTCTAYGQCPFTIICTAREPEVWYNDFVIRRWNPLLRNPIDNRKLEMEMSRPILQATLTPEILP